MTPCAVFLAQALTSSCRSQYLRFTLTTRSPQEKWHTPGDFNPLALARNYVVCTRPCMKQMLQQRVMAGRGARPASAVDKERSRK